MSDLTIAKEILRQLGGNRFITMTGARNFSADDNSLSFQIPRIRGVRGVTITLNGDDLYTMEFFKLDKKAPYQHLLHSETGLFFDMLQETFTDITGFDTHL